MDTIARIVKEYLLGVTKGGEVIFYQIDSKGRCRTGKVMKYDPLTGHRIKDPTAKTPITWVHSLLKQQGLLPQEWELSQCLFGEHLLKLYPEKVVALVESEKTAVICSALRPECIWLATGGKGQLNDRVEVLQGRRIVSFPDVDGYDVWVEKASERPHLHIAVSDFLEKSATRQQRDAHIDIADILIEEMRTRNSGVSSPNKEPPPAELVSTNPVFLEVQKYISPEYWENVAALIEELDLEFVGVTRIYNEDKSPKIGYDERIIPAGELEIAKIESRIVTVRGIPVILDRDLALMYGVDLAQMNRQVKRNIQRFPEDFMFQLTREEYSGLKCQNGILNNGASDGLEDESLRSQNGSIKAGRGQHSKYLPYAFTE